MNRSWHLHGGRLGRETPRSQLTRGARAGRGSGREVGAQREETWVLALRRRRGTRFQEHGLLLQLGRDIQENVV